MRRVLFPITIVATLTLMVSVCPQLFGQDPDRQTKPVTMIGATGEAAKYWPGWRGPNRQGVAADGDYVDTWSDTKNVIWKAKVPGDGNSSPIIFKDSIFLTTSHEKGERRSILCLDRANGKVRWETFTPEGDVERTQKKNGFASGTPVTDGERVYAYFGNFGLMCVDVSGKRLWHQSFGDINALHGTACSPLLYGDAVIVFQDQRTKGKSFVAAYDKRTGKELWKTVRQEKVGWGSPVAIRVGDEDQIIVSSSRAVYAYDPQNGEMLWKCDGNLYEVTPTPVVGHNLLYCSSGRAGPTLAIQPTGRGNVTKSHLQWQTVKGSPFIPSPVLVGEHLYILNDIISVVTCFDAKSGEVVWQSRLGEPLKHGFSASPVAVNGKLFFTNDSGETYVVRAGAKYELLGVNRLGEKTLASPALVDGKWYIRTAEHLYCIGK